MNKRKPIWCYKFKNFCINHDLRASEVAEILNLKTATIYKYFAGDISVPDENKKILEKKLGLDIYDTFFNEEL